MQTFSQFLSLLVTQCTFLCMYGAAGSRVACPDAVGRPGGSRARTALYAAVHHIGSTLIQVERLPASTEIRCKLCRRTLPTTGATHTARQVPESCRTDG